MELLRRTTENIRNRVSGTRKTPEIWRPSYFCTEEQIQSLYGEITAILERAGAPWGTDFRIFRGPFANSIATMCVIRVLSEGVIIVGTRAEDYYTSMAKDIDSTEELRLTKTGHALTSTSSFGRHNCNFSQRTRQYLDLYLEQHLQEMRFDKHRLKGYLDPEHVAAYYQPLIFGDFWWQGVIEECRKPTSRYGGILTGPGHASEMAIW